MLFFIMNQSSSSSSDEEDAGDKFDDDDLDDALKDEHDDGPPTSKPVPPHAYSGRDFSSTFAIYIYMYRTGNLFAHYQCKVNNSISTKHR